MDHRITFLADILRLNTKLFRNCLESLPDEAAGLRPSPTTNSAAFVAAHLADSRFPVQHDSYHIGPLALLRKYAGLPAMRYT